MKNFQLFVHRSDARAHISHVRYITLLYFAVYADMWFIYVYTHFFLWFRVFFVLLSFRFLDSPHSVYLFYFRFHSTHIV